MDALALSPATLSAAIVALSFAAGLNVYATALSLGIMGRLHWVALPPGLDPLMNPWIMGASAFLFAGHFVADKIPGFDVVFNLVHTFVRIPIAALLAFAAGEHLTPEMHLLVTVLGAVVAAVAHSSKTAARVAVTPSPEPLSNIALSTAEDAAAIGLPWLALHHPVATGGTVAGLTVVLAVSVWLAARRLRRTFRNWRTRREQSSSPAFARAPGR